MRGRIGFLLMITTALFWGVADATGARAASPSGATIGPDHPSGGWNGKVFVAAATASPALCPLPADSNNVLCDHFKLTVGVSRSYWSTHTGGVSVTIRWGSGANNFDLYLYDASGSQVASSAASSGTTESLSLPRATGTYEVRVVPKLVANSGYAGSALFSSRAIPPPSPKPSPQPPRGGPGGGAGGSGGSGGYSPGGSYYPGGLYPGNYPAPYGPGGTNYFGPQPTSTTSKKVVYLGQGGTQAQASGGATQSASSGLSRDELLRVLWIMVPVGLMLFAAASLAVFHPEEERDRRVAAAALKQPVEVLLVPPRSLVGLVGHGIFLAYRGTKAGARGIGRSARWARRRIGRPGPGATGDAIQKA